MWRSTMGEFLDVLAGAVELDRDRRYFQSLAACSMGGDPFVLIGERSIEEQLGNADPKLADGWMAGTPEGDRAKRVDKLMKLDLVQDLDRLEAHRQWMPKGLG